MVDWANHYDQIYTVLGVSATLVTNGSVAQASLTVIDKTRGLEAFDGAILTVRPAAIVRMSEVIENGLTHDDFNGASLTFNGRTWRVKAQQPSPAPTGEDAGELFLFLEQAA